MTATFDLQTVDLGDGRRVVRVRAGRHKVERVVPPAGDAAAYDRDAWDHEVNVYVSRTGRSVRVFVDGEEVSLGINGAERA